MAHLFDEPCPRRFRFQGNQRDPMRLDNLRNRVDDELEHFNKTFSAAQKEEIPQNLESLADAADQLMRAIGEF
jgi:hypothetical protein